MLSDHSEYDGAYTRARLVGLKREAGENHPFVVGADGVQLLHGDGGMRAGLDAPGRREVTTCLVHGCRRGTAVSNAISRR
jgi:hypothetical protein